MREHSPAQGSGDEKPDDLYQTFNAHNGNGDFDSRKAREILQENGVSYKEAVETPNFALPGKLGEMAAKHEAARADVDPHVQVSEALVKKTEEIAERGEAAEERIAALEAQLAEVDKKAQDMVQMAQNILGELAALRAERATATILSANEAGDEGQFIDRSNDQAIGLKDILPVQKNVQGERGRFTGERQEFITPDQLDQIEAHADQIREGQQENRDARKAHLEGLLADEAAIAATAREQGKNPSDVKRQIERDLTKVNRDAAGADNAEHTTDDATAGDVQVQPADTTEPATETRELAPNQPRAVRQDTNGEILKKVVYTNGDVDWVPIEPKNTAEVAPDNEASADSEPQEGANTSEVTSNSGGEDSAEDEPKDEADTDKNSKITETMRQAAAGYDLDDPLQLGQYRAKLDKDLGISTIHLDPETVKRIATGEGEYSSASTDALSDEGREKIEDRLRNRKERLEQAEKIGILGAERGSDQEREKIEELKAEIALLEGRLAPRDTADQPTNGETDKPTLEGKKKAIEAYDRERLKNLKNLQAKIKGEISDLQSEEADVRAAAEKARNEGREDEAARLEAKADEIGNQIVVKNMELENIDKTIAELETGEAGGEKPTNPKLDTLSAREDEASKEKAEKDKALGEAADKLAQLKAQPWFRKDKEAIAAAEAEYFKLAQETGREIVNGYEDEAARQSMFAATQVAMWEDINMRVAEIKKQTKYGKFTELFGKMHPAARMAIMAGAGVGIGVAAAAVGTVSGGIGGAAVIAGVTAWAAKIARAKVNVDIAGTEANKTREKGKFDAFMAGASRVTGLAQLTKWGERRLDKKFAKKEAEAIKTINLRGSLNELSQDDIDARIGQRKAELTVEKNSARTRRALTTSALLMAGGATASFIAAETLGMPSLEDKLNAKGGQTKLEDVPARDVLPRDRMTDDEYREFKGLDPADSQPVDESETFVDGPLPGEYTADTIDVSYQEYLSGNKISDWAMGEKMDMTSTETAMDDMWELGEADPGHAGQMVQGYLSESQKAELGLGGMTPQEVENTLHDDATRAAALNMIAEQLGNGGAKVEIVDNVSGNFYNWGARPVDANGNTISMEDARANGIQDTELVQTESYLQNVSLLRVTDADGNVSYFNSECKNFLTEKPTPDIPVGSDPTAENPSDMGVENPSDHNAENPGTAPDGEAENPGTAPNAEEENPGTAPDAEEESPSDEIEENPKTEDASEYPTAPDMENPSDQNEENPSDEAEESPSDEVEENPSDENEENPSDQNEENPSDPVEENPSDRAEENPSDQNEENPSDEAEENPSDEITENPKSDTDDYGEYPTDEAPEAEVDPGQGETTPPVDAEAPATPDEKPHEEVPADHDAGTAEEAAPVTPEEREEEIDQAPVDLSAPSEDAPGTEVTGPGGGGTPAVSPQPAPQPAPEPATPATPPASAEVDTTQGETTPPEGS